MAPLDFSADWIAPFRFENDIAVLPVPARQERRESYRLELKPGQATLRVGTGHAAVVQDLSATGGQFVLQGLSPAPFGDLQVQLEFGNGESLQTEVEVVRTRSQAAGVVTFGARFAQIRGTDLTKLSRFITDEHLRRTSNPARLLNEGPSLRINNPLFISNLFTSSQSRRDRRLLVLDGSLRLPITLVVEGTEFLGSGRVLRARFLGPSAVLLSDRPYTFMLTGTGAVTVFQATCLEQDGTEVRLTAPGEVRQTGFRQSPRVVLSPSSSVGVQVDHPRLTGARLAGQLSDIAGKGISFQVDANNHALFPGDRLVGIQLAVPDGVVEAMGIVRGIAGRDGGPSTCGVELTDFTGRADAERWHRFVLQNSHPNLLDMRECAEAAWDVLERSKYIDLWTPAQHRAHVRENFVRSWQKPSVTVGNTLGLQNDGAPVGLSAGSLAYPGTWILHHLGIVSKPSAPDAQLVMRQASELITGLLYRLRDMADMEHFVIYAEKGKRWNDRLYTEFAARYGDKSKILCSPFRVYRRSSETASPAVEPLAGIELVPASPALWTMLAREHRRTLSPIECQAYGYGEGDIDLVRFASDCAVRGYERGRAGYLALANGKPIAALVAETGNEGVNVFGLLNSCRMFPLGLEPLSGSVRALLLDKAIEHYRQAGKRTFLLFDSATEEDATCGSLGYESISPALRLLAHRDVIPAWAAYLRGLLNAAKGQRPGQGESLPAVAVSAAG